MLGRSEDIFDRTWTLWKRVQTCGNPLGPSRPNLKRSWGVLGPEAAQKQRQSLFHCSRLFRHCIEGLKATRVCRPARIMQGCSPNMLHVCRPARLGFKQASLSLCFFVPGPAQPTTAFRQRWTSSWYGEGAAIVEKFTVASSASSSILLSKSRSSGALGGELSVCGKVSDSKSDRKHAPAGRG